MTETTRATNKLPKHDVAEGVSAPSVRVSTFDFLRLFPALLLHTIWETSRVEVRVWGDFEVVEESGIFVFSDKGGVKKRGGGGWKPSSWARPRWPWLEPRWPNGSVPCWRWPASSSLLDWPHLLSHYISSLSPSSPSKVSPARSINGYDSAMLAFGKLDMDPILPRQHPYYVSSWISASLGWCGRRVGQLYTK